MALSHRDHKQASDKKETVLKGGSLVSAALKQHVTAKKETLSTDYSSLENVSKASLVRISVSELPKEIPDFKAPGSTKDHLVTDWLKNFIMDALEAGKVTENHLLPRKEDIAKHLGVSVGTVQNAIRSVEDEGCVESKQRIGTLIRDVRNDTHRMRKQTSKRDRAVVAIQQLIIEQAIQPGETLPSAREIASQIGSAPNTTRLALEYLTTDGILISRGTRGNKANWELKVIPDAVQESSCAIESETLIDQLERDLKTLIADEYAVHDKLPSHLELAECFKVSIKTVHDAMKRLADQGVISSKRGRYGTFILRKPDTNFFSATTLGQNIFVSVDDATFYNYEKVEQHLKQLIQNRFDVGAKLPSMGQLAKELDVSSNTIRKALQNLAKENVVSFTRGRYGGTFVTEMPEVSEEAATFTWVSINPETIKSYRQSKVTH